MCAVRHTGAVRSENAGMSSDKSDEKSDRRKPKVSDSMLIRIGLIGPTVRPIGVADGLQVKIPVLGLF